MAKQAPKYIIKKIERMSDMMEELVQLNMEVEGWLEKNGIYDGFDFSNDHRDDRGYGIWDVDRYVAAINEAINE